MSERNTSETSFHVLMAKIDIDSVEDPIERYLLIEYKECSHMLEVCRSRKSALTMSLTDFRTDPSKTDEDIEFLNNAIKRIVEIENLRDSQLVKVCQAPQLKALYERELPAARQRQKQKNAEVNEAYLEKRREYLKKK